MDRVQVRHGKAPKPDSDGYNCGHVGNLQTVKEDLRAIVDFLTNED